MSEEVKAKRVKKPKSKARKIIEWVLTGLFVALFAVIMAGQIDGWVHKKDHYNQQIRFGYATFVVQTDSMEPDYKVKSAIVTYLEPADKIYQRYQKKEKVDLTLDIIDFLLNYGSQEIIEELAQKDFLNTILSLLKNKAKSGVNIQKKIIFLTQKWHKKFEKDENPKIKGFSDNYNILKKGGIIFPPQSYQIQTYNNFISEEESQNSLMKANAIKKLTKESEEIKKSMNFANPFSNESANSYDNEENNIFLYENTTVVKDNNNKNENENENENEK